MTIKKIIRSDLCNGGGCPGVIITDEENIFVQGYIPSASERGQLAGPDGEDFVRMPRAMFEQIARQVLNA